MNNILFESNLKTDAKPGFELSRSRHATIDALQYLRAIAALSVVLCHASYYVKQFRDDPRMWEIFDRGGQFGVVLFFSISGFLMAQLAQDTPPMRFLAHRLIRIYPIYWFTIGLVVLYNHFSGVSIRPNIFALVLAPGATRSYVLGVEWTLPFELTFYTLVFLVILAGLQKRIVLVACVWIASIELMLIFRPELQEGQFPLLLHVPLSKYSLAFAAGMLVPAAIKGRYGGPITWLIGLCALATSEAVQSALISFQLVTIGCVLIMASAVRPAASGNERKYPALRLLGDWSYALYLCHVPIIMALCQALPASIQPMQVWFACIGAPILASIVLGKIDLSMYRALRLIIDKSGKLVTGLAVALFLLALLGSGGYTYFRRFQAMAASADLAAVAAMIEGDPEARPFDLALAAEKAGFSPDQSLRGFVDSVSRNPEGQVYIQGWAVDASNSGRIPKVMVFHCGRFLGAALPQFARPDVATALQIRNGNFGFDATFQEKTPCDDADVNALLVTTDGHYGAVSAKLQ
jgi:exopolysaccharide production protein ExoZ